MTSKKQKVGIFVPTLLGGGAEHVMVTLANAFVARGLYVDLLCGSSRGPNRARVSSGVNVVDFGASHVLQCIIPLSRYLRANRPDAILSAMTHANNSALIARSLSGVRTRLVVSERVSIDWVPTNKREAIHRYLRSWLYRSADHLVMVAQSECDEAAHRFGLARHKVSHIYNPIVTQEFDRARMEPPSHPWLKECSPSQGPVIMTVGRLEAQKDHLTLLRAFAEIRTRFAARLIIVGEGTLRPVLEQEIRRLGLEADVSLPGFVTNPIKELKCCDLFVLSSKFEGLPGALVQALGCGRRIVSTDCPTGPLEILERGKWGKLVPIGDVYAMAQAIEAALSEPPRAAAEQAVAPFKLAHSVDAYLSVLLPD